MDAQEIALEIVRTRKQLEDMEAAMDGFDVDADTAEEKKRLEEHLRHLRDLSARPVKGRVRA